MFIFFSEVGHWLCHPQECTTSILQKIWRTKTPIIINLKLYLWLAHQQNNLFFCHRLTCWTHVRKTWALPILSCIKKSYPEMYLHYCHSHVKKNRFIVNASELTMLMDSSNIFSLVSSLPIRQTKRDGCHGVCVQRVQGCSLGCLWWSETGVQEEEFGRGSSNTRRDLEQSFSFLCCCISSNFNSSFGDYLAVKLVAPLLSNIWQGFTCISPLCIYLWLSLMQPKAWTRGAQHCCEGEMSSGAVRRWMFDIGQKCFLRCVFAKSVTGKPILRKTLHSCYEWTLLLPKYDWLSGANQW